MLYHSTCKPISILPFTAHRSFRDHLISKHLCRSETRAEAVLRPCERSSDFSPLIRGPPAIDSLFFTTYIWSMTESRRLEKMFTIAFSLGNVVCVLPLSSTHHLLVFVYCSPETADSLLDTVASTDQVTSQVYSLLNSTLSKVENFAEKASLLLNQVKQSDNQLVQQLVNLLSESPLPSLLETLLLSLVILSTNLSSPPFSSFTRSSHPPLSLQHYYLFPPQKRTLLDLFHRFNPSPLDLSAHSQENPTSKPIESITVQGRYDGLWIRYFG